jgi:diguanylate cyclase (GGDEF)-like protein
METIMLALQNDKDCRLIEKELAEEYSVKKARGRESCEEEMDLLVFDLPTFKQCQGICEKKIEEEEPLFLPVLLLVKRGKEEAVAQYLGDTVDDILLTPLKKVELKTRIESLLRTRRFSLKYRDEMKEETLTDPLTGLYNRRYFDEFIDKEAERAKRYGHPVAFCMMDMNNFKEVNDRYSHMVGDEVLKEISKLLKDNIRESDVLVRFGGDEFLLVMPETNGESTTVVERIGDKLEEWNENTELIDQRLGIAMGHSHWLPGEDGSIEEALKEADESMYEDKDRIDY